MKSNESRHPTSKPAKNTKGSGDRETTVIYGVMPVMEALRSSAGRIRKIVLSTSRADRRTREIRDLAQAQGVPVVGADRSGIADLVPSGATHQGVAAFVRNVEFSAPESLIGKAMKDTSPTLLVLDGVEDPRNLGAIIRTAECAGTAGIFLPERRSAGITDTAVKASAGAVNGVDIAKVTNVARLLKDLKSSGIWTVGTSSDAPMIYHEWDFTQPTAVVLGGEGKGIRRLTAENCDALVKIPMYGRIESLNVSVAAGVLLFESVRQKTLESI